MRRLWILGLGFALGGCGDNPQVPPGDTSRWALPDTSMNLAILLVNYHTYEIDGGILSQYALCDGCDTDSIPFRMSHHSGKDHVDFVFEYEATGDTVFAYRQGWMGGGRILYPESLWPADSFAVLETPVPAPADPQLYLMPGGVSEDSAQAMMDSAWATVAALDITKAFGLEAFRVGYCIYAPWAPGWQYHEDNAWVIFLYLGTR